MKIALIVVLILALAASIAAGLAGLWPNLRHRSSVNDRRERVRIASAFDRDVLSGQSFHVSRVRPDYIPGKALAEITEYGHPSNRSCAVVAENFGDRVGPEDFASTACDF